MIDTLRNADIAVDQDPFAVQGVRVAVYADGDVYSFATLNGAAVGEDVG
ncbi:hypothetical protein [Streptomyces phaeochromogenes]